MPSFSLENMIKAHELKWSKPLKDFPLIADIWEVKPHLSQKPCFALKGEKEDILPHSCTYMAEALKRRANKIQYEWKCKQTGSTNSNQVLLQPLLQVSASWAAGVSYANLSTQTLGYSPSCCKYLILHLEALHFFPLPSHVGRPFLCF